MAVSQISGARSDTDPDAPGGIIGKIAAFFFGHGSRTRQSAANRGWVLTLGGAAILGLVLVFVLSIPDGRRFAASALVAVAAAMAGALLGFLFGLPRSRRDPVATVPAAAAVPPVMPDGDPTKPPVSPTDAHEYIPNTNLDDISDWLTKILVGVGLTQLGTIPDQFQRLVNFTRSAIGTGEEAASITAAILVAYAIIGFMACYLWARTRAATAFRLADTIEQQRQLHNLQARVNTIEATTKPTTPP